MTTQRSMRGKCFSCGSCDMLLDAPPQITPRILREVKELNTYIDAVDFDNLHSSQNSESSNTYQIFLD